MIRLLKIELQKLRPYKPFWILGGLYLLLMIGLSLSSHAILDWWSGLLGNGIQGILPIDMPIFDFVDIWQNLTWVGRFYLPVLGFLIVISVYNEINHNTLKQNIIDGMSRNEWVMSKIILLLFISLVAGVAVLFSGLYMGSLHSSVTSYEYIVKNIAFVPAYMLQVVNFLSLAMLLTVLLKKSMLSFGLLLILYFPLELIIRQTLPDALDKYHEYFPILALSNVIHVPFGKYIFQDIQDYLTLNEIALAAFYTLLYWALTFLVVRKRDL